MPLEVNSQLTLVNTSQDLNNVVLMSDVKIAYLRVWKGNLFLLLLIVLFLLMKIIKLVLPRRLPEATQKISTLGIQRIYLNLGTLFPADSVQQLTRWGCSIEV